MTYKDYYAHTKTNPDGTLAPQSEWQLLKDHLINVANLAKKFAQEARPGDNDFAEAAYAAGLLHDLGKYRDEFQSYLRRERYASIETRHAVYGAAYALKSNPEILLPIAFGVAGHHASLHNINELQEMQFPEVLSTIIDRFQVELPTFQINQLKSPAHIIDESTAEFYTRLLFSCIVDSDRLDTAFWPIKPPADRELNVDELLQLLINERTKKSADSPDNVLKKLRNDIFDECIKKADLSQGFFSLTVPTGGGKTLSSMAFALSHAKKHGLRRIIVVIPYLSIIEQNAAEYRRIFGDDVVLENHSMVESPEDLSEEEKSHLELVSENWDSPIVVTTSVQFLESLFADNPSRCRKLHRIARSVVVFDEVQTLPAHMLQPSLNVFRELVRNYGVSFVFSSATQPAFRCSSSLTDGFKPEELREIAPEPQKLFKSLRRVNYHLPADNESLDWPQLAREILEERQALCVVNLVRHANNLWEELLKISGKERPFHLSAAMCPQHRLDCLSEIRRRLKDNLPCRVVSTQLIEAGVDVDFPVVWRAFGPLDSIVQVAGRCNREGLLPDGKKGEMYVFRPLDNTLPPGYRAVVDQSAITLAALGKNNSAEERLAIDADFFGDYFNSLWQAIKVGDDIQEERKKFRFRKVASEAKVIKDLCQPVIVCYGEGKDIVKEIRSRTGSGNFSRFTSDDLRRLQRFMVNVRPHNFKTLYSRKNISQILPNIELYVLDDGLYHPELGLIIDKRPLEDYLQ
ncbi:MAG: CRISPR-associated helicase/endonuclease Cas3 [Elusimicrobiota bacterium]